MIKGDLNILTHSYLNTPPIYTEPQSFFYFTNSGYTGITGVFEWTVEPPLYIVSGQETSKLTCQLIPQNSTQISGYTSQISTKIYLSGTTDYLIDNELIHYRKGPLWKISGVTENDMNPKIEIISGKTKKSICTYKLIPLYDAPVYDPKRNFTNTQTYSFSIKNGKIEKFYGTNPPYSNLIHDYPTVDIFWYSTGITYISFYSSWMNEYKFPNTLEIIINTKQ